MLKCIEQARVFDSTGVEKTHAKSCLIEVEDAVAKFGFEIIKAEELSQGYIHLHFRHRSNGYIITIGCVKHTLGDYELGLNLGRYDNEDHQRKTFPLSDLINKEKMRSHVKEVLMPLNLVFLTNNSSFL